MPFPDGARHTLFHDENLNARVVVSALDLRSLTIGITLRRDNSFKKLALLSLRRRITVENCARMLKEAEGGLLEAGAELLREDLGGG